MARPLRIELAGGLYHVMSRGNERRAIVRDDADCQRRVDWLGRTVQTYGWRLHAFVLMGNYEHLFWRSAGTSISIRCGRSWSSVRSSGGGAAIGGTGGRGRQRSG